MNNKLFRFLLQLNICYNLCDFVNGKPLLGDNITPVEISEYNFIVTIIQIDNGAALEDRILCIGSLISHYHIMTSAFCTFGINDIIFGILAESNILQQTTLYDPIWWLTHYQWTQNENIIFTDSHDIATIKLIQPVGRHIIPAHISTVTQYNTLWRDDVVLIGWGGLNNRCAPRILKKANVKIVSRSACSTLASRLNTISYEIPSVNLCTRADPYVRITEIDYGGPLLHQGKILALNVGVFPNEAESYSDAVNYHIGVHIYANFIRSILKM